MISHFMRSTPLDRKIKLLQEASFTVKPFKIYRENTLEVNISCQIWYDNNIMVAMAYKAFICKGDLGKDSLTVGGPRTNQWSIEVVESIAHQGDSDWARVNEIILRNLVANQSLPAPHIFAGIEAPTTDQYVDISNLPLGN